MGHFLSVLEAIAYYQVPVLFIVPLCKAIDGSERSRTVLNAQAC